MSQPSDSATVPVLGFAAGSGTGKTTLLASVVPLLREAGVRLALVKQAHPDFDLDQPGKDSYELRKAGASRVLLASRQRWALLVERAVEREPVLEELLEELDRHDLDLVLVEGFSAGRFAKVELHRPALGREPMYPTDEAVVAVATDAPLAAPCALPVLDLNEPRAVADFVVDWLAQAGSGPAEPDRR